MVYDPNDWQGDFGVTDYSSTANILSVGGDPSLYSGGSASGGGMGIGQGLQGAGMLMKAYGTLQAGKATKQADEYNAALVRQAGVMEQYKLGKAEVGLASTQRAMYAKAGVTQSGSPLDTMLQTAAGFELDKQISKYNTESKANMLEWEGKMAQQQAKSAATMQLLEGAASFAMMLA